MKNQSIPPLRTVTPEGAASHQRCPVCERPGCEQATRERKPFCPDHVDELPYVARLLQVLEATSLEHEAVRKRGARAVQLGGVTAREILSQLRQYGGRSVERLSRDLQLSCRVIQSYADALAGAGLVSLGRSSRNNVILQLTTKRWRPGQKTTGRKWRGVKDSAA